MAVIEDVIGGSITVDSSGGNAVRIFIVDDIPASVPDSETASELPSAHLYNILSETGIPAYGEAHPSVSSLFVSSIVVTPENNENSICRVVVGYSVPTFETKEPDESDNGLIQIGATVTTTKTNKDESGAAITVSLTNQDDQLAEVDVLVPETVLSFERRESESPAAKARTYVGKVNSVALGSGAYAIGTLLCTGIEGTSTDDGATYSVTYRFQYNENTWALDVIYIDPETNLPHKDVVLSGSPDGVTEDVEVYSEVNFTALNLSF